MPFSYVLCTVNVTTDEEWITNADCVLIVIVVAPDFHLFDALRVLRGKRCRMQPFVIGRLIVITIPFRKDLCNKQEGISSDADNLDL